MSEMSPGEVRGVLRLLAERWMPSAREKCSMCGTPDTWNLDTELGRIDAIEPPRHFPVAIVTCGHCGYTVMFNAVALGVIWKTPEESTPEPNGAEA